MAEFNYSCKKLKVSARKEGLTTKTPSNALSGKKQKLGDNTDCVGIMKDLMIFISLFETRVMQNCRDFTRNTRKDSKNKQLF